MKSGARSGPGALRLLFLTLNGHPSIFDMNEKPENVSAITRQIQRHLAYLSGLGLKGVDCRRETLDRIAEWGRPPLPADESAADIAAELKHCQKCGLAGLTTQAVAGCGDPAARLMVIGAWPEPEDGMAGRPFSGRDGELLSRMLKAMDLSRDAVYISYALKCPPPSAHPPQARDLEACRLFLYREIAVVRPEIICTLGDAALQALLGDNALCAKDRGRFHEFKGIALMPTYSPAYLLANPSAKRETWDDMKQVIARLANPAGTV